MRCEFLGTGTSYGIPVIGCGCVCCRSPDSRDKRLRSSLWITEGDSSAPATSILIDIGPDFRSQALKSSINKLDGLLLTHSHADHLNGLDDIRIFSHTGSRSPALGDGKVYPETAGEGLPIYGNTIALEDVRRRFSYIFLPVQEGGGRPKVKTVDCREFDAEHPLVVGRLTIIPVPLLHGRLETTGWMVLEGYHEGNGACGGVAYLTDCNHVPQESRDLLARFAPHLHHLVIDGLRPTSHVTHFSFDQALELALEIGCRKNWLTHICHDMTHREIEEYLERLLADRGRPSFHCRPAYDGLVLEV